MLNNQFLQLTHSAIWIQNSFWSDVFHLGNACINMSLLGTVNPFFITRWGVSGVLNNTLTIETEVSMSILCISGSSFTSNEKTPVTNNCKKLEQSLTSRLRHWKQVQDHSAKPYSTGEWLSDVKVQISFRPWMYNAKTRTLFIYRHVVTSSVDTFYQKYKRPNATVKCSRLVFRKSRVQISAILRFPVVLPRHSRKLPIHYLKSDPSVFFSIVH